jgi:hypothetical protein
MVQQEHKMIEESEHLYKLPALAELLKQSRDYPPPSIMNDKSELTIGERWSRWVKSVDN